MKTEMVPLDKIRIDGGTQARVGMNQQTLHEYMELRKAKVQLPPAVVFFDGADYWMADGFHRFFAEKGIGGDELGCVVHAGTARDAQLHAVGANARHGLRRTSDDKEKAVRILLADQEWGTRSVDWLSEMASVSWAFADKVRTAWLTEQGRPESATVIASDGRERKACNKSSGGIPARECPEGAESAAPGPDPFPDAGPTDTRGRPVPQRLIDVFAAVKPIRGLIQKVGGIMADVEDLRQAPGGARLAPARIKIDLGNVQQQLRSAIPYAVCPECDGEGAGCNRCDGSGWLVETEYGRLPNVLRKKAESFGETKEEVVA